MPPVIKRYMPDGSIRAVWNDSQAVRERGQGNIPRRASRIEVILDGPLAGLFHVDFSPLADVEGKDQYRVCLPQTFKEYGEANAQEVAWLVAHYVMEITECAPFENRTTSSS